MAAPLYKSSRYRSKSCVELFISRVPVGETEKFHNTVVNVSLGNEWRIGRCIVHRVFDNQWIQSIFFVASLESRFRQLTPPLLQAALGSNIPLLSLSLLLLPVKFPVSYVQTPLFPPVLHFLFVVIFLFCHLASFCNFKLPLEFHCPFQVSNLLPIAIPLFFQAQYLLLVMILLFFPKVLRLLSSLTLFRLRVSYLF